MDIICVYFALRPLYTGGVTNKRHKNAKYLPVNMLVKNIHTGSDSNLQQLFD